MLIGVSFSTGLLVYLIGFLALIIFLWVRSLLRGGRNQWQLNNSRLFDCDSCHYAFLADEAVNLTRCPRCNAICIRRQKRRRSFRS